MKTETTLIPGVIVLTPKVFEDERGFFFESYNKSTLADVGITENFVQDNHAKSSENVIRGLHYQEKHPQAKLIRVLQGTVLDVIVDIRKASPAFGKWMAIEVSAQNKKQIWIPEGLAHGYAVLSETAEFFYKVTDHYHPEDEQGIRWNDPYLNINWRVVNPVVSTKDQNLPFFKEASDSFSSF